MTQEELIKKIDAEITKLSDNACLMAIEDGGYRVACMDISDMLHKIAKEIQPSLPSNLDEAAQEYFLKTYGINNIAISEDIKKAVKFGAEWMAGQGVSMQITDDTEWEEVDSFIHKNVDGGSIIQIRLCEAILFEWKDAADLARKTLTQIKAREKE